jgi:hypothetical protein
MRDIKYLPKRDYDNLTLLLDKRQKLIEDYNAKSTVTRTFDESLQRQRQFKRAKAALDCQIENIMREPIQYFGFPVSARVRHKITGQEGQVESPYTCAGAEIIQQGKILVSNFGEYGIDPNDIELT